MGSAADAGQEQVIEPLTSERDGRNTQVSDMHELMEEMRETMRGMKRLRCTESTAYTDNDWRLVGSAESAASDPAVAKQSVESPASPASEEGNDTKNGKIEEIDDVASITTTKRRWVGEDACSVKRIGEKTALCA